MTHPHVPAPLTRPHRTAILLRHAEREHITHPASSGSVPITERGRQAAVWLGQSLTASAPFELVHSPIDRCRQTAEALRDGARSAGKVANIHGSDARLGGAYLLDPARALDLAGQLGHRFVRDWFDNKLPPQALKSRAAAAHDQLAAVVDHLDRSSEGTVLLVTHDWNLLAVREELFGLRHEDDHWPGFLDGLTFARAESQLIVTWESSVGSAHGPSRTVVLPFKQA